MDVISLGKATKAKKIIKKLQDRLGMNGTEQGKDVRDIYANVKTRLEELEKKDPHITLYNRVSEVEANTAINLNKHNLHIKSILNKNKYGLTDLVFDDFGDDSGIDHSKSTGYEFDSVGRKVKIADGQTQAEIVTTAEETNVVPRMITVSQAFNEKLTGESPVDLVNGIYTNTVNNKGKIELSVTSPSEATQITYSPTGTYESPVLDLGDNFKDIIKIDQVINIPSVTTGQTAASVKLYTSTSSDNVTFSDWQPVNSDGTITSPSARYIKVKVELTGGAKILKKLIYDFASTEASNFEANDKVIFDGNLKLKTIHTDNMISDSSFIEEGTLLRKTIDKNIFKTIEKIDIV